MIQSIRRMLALFSSEERLSFMWVLLSMLAMGFLQMVGVGVVLPFVSLLSNPAAIHENVWLEWIYTGMGFQSSNGFLIFVGSALLVVLVASNIFTAYTIWLMTHFTWGVQERISARLLSGYLHQPYEAFLNRNSAETGKNILIESQQFANGVLMPLLKATAFGITGLMIIGFLVWLNPLVACGVAVIFGCAYLGIYLAIRRSLLRIGRDRMTANTERFQSVNESFGSIKEVKVTGREDAFLQRYTPAAGKFATALAKSQVLSQIPRFAIEGLAFALVMAAMLFLLATGSDIGDALPVASAFVLAGYRLLPALQNVYQGITQCRFSQSVMDTLYHDLVDKEGGGPNTDRAQAGVASPSLEFTDREKLSFEKEICLQGVSYRYPNAPISSLEDIDVKIAKNSFVALTGTTGAGKTTLADVILGLLEPTEGSISVDGTRITRENRRQWQANLGYVPQDIYLTDNSIAANIAYGIDSSKIDQAAVERAARIANIHEFIVNKLAHGYDTVAGERGVRLSGGQRQRIGIARALYHDPSVIVLDEATSALDNETERHIVNELDAMRGGRTLIVIAHRLTTVQKCNEVFMLRAGKVAARGSYQELVAESAEFSNLAEASTDESQ